MTTQELRSENTHRNFRRNIVRRRRECMHKTLESKIDYKDVVTLRRYITDRGRIIPAKRTGNCAKCQRELNTAIKRARFLAFLPYSPQHLKLTGKILSDTTLILNLQMRVRRQHQLILNLQMRVHRQHQLILNPRSKIQN